jgi:hypothetical protein
VAVSADLLSAQQRAQIQVRASVMGGGGRGGG